jgi:hypothetical protein
MAKQKSTNKEVKPLILGQKGEQKEAMSFSDDSRPSPDVQSDLSNRETPFDKVDFPNAPEEHENYEELLASEEYKHALDKLAEYTGVRNIGTGINGQYAQLSNQAGRILGEVMRAETTHESELEQLCETLIRDYFKIPENRIQFDFKLVKQSIKLNNTQTKQQLQQKEEELADDVNELNPERAKRRIVNAMTQGHAVDGSYLFEKVVGELENIMGVQGITEKYAIFVSTMMLGYWQFPNEMLSAAGSGEGGASGKTRIDTSTNPPTIHAEAMIFPFLIHEAIKGVMEFLGKERKPENPENYEKAKDLEDQVQHEIWDIRLGRAIWKRLTNLYPDAIVTDEEKKKIQYYIYVNIVNLPVKEFLLLFKEIMGGTDMGKTLIGAIYYDLTRKVDNETVTTSDSEFKRLMDEFMEEHKDDDLTDFLSQMGISLPK